MRVYQFRHDRSKIKLELKRSTCCNLLVDISKSRAACKSMETNTKDLSSSNSIELKLNAGTVGYYDAVAFMEDRVEKIYHRQEKECIWMLQHPDIYTAGTSSKEKDLVRW